MISRRVRHFLAVAEEGSFTRAALRLGIGQPPLSQSIQRLEEELGVKLLKRTPKGVRLTAAGEAFIADARHSVAAADRARAAARAATVKQKPVRVGVILPAIWAPLKRLVRAAGGVGIELELIDGSTEQLLAMLCDGRLDISFVAPPIDPIPELQRIEIGREPLVAALPEDLADAPGEFAPMKEMAARLILPPRPYGPVMHDALVSMFTVAGYAPVVVAETTRVLTTLALTSAGVGSAIVAPSLARSVRMEGVSFRPFAPSVITPFWEIALVHFETRPDCIVGRLVEAARAEFGAAR